MKMYFRLFLITCLSVFAIYGCGGGSSGSGSVSDPAVETPAESRTISGVAATGAAAAEREVFLTGYDGVTKSTFTDSSGYYELDVTGIQAPYVIWFQKGSMNIYSTDCGNDVVNINPVSDVVTRALYIQGGGDGNPVASLINANDCGLVQQKVKSIISPILQLYGVSDDTDLISMAGFTADSNGLDGIFDDYNILIIGNNLVVSSKVDNNPIVDISVAQLTETQEAVAAEDITEPMVYRMLNRILNLIDFSDIKNENESMSDVQSDLSLFTETVNNVTVSWDSSNTAVISDTGAVTIPVNDTSVTLTMTLGINGFFVNEEFVLIVKGSEGPSVPGQSESTLDAESVAAAKAALTIEDVIGNSRSEDKVIFNLNLMDSGEEETAISWKSDNTSVISDAGLVTRPDLSAGAKTVTMTATITKGEATDTKTFTVTVPSAIPAVLAGGYGKQLVLKSDGTIWGVGTNGYGTLGDGTTTNATDFVQESSLSTDWLAVAANENSAAALKTDGTIWCWGSNSNGMLGNGTESNSSDPVQEATAAADWIEVSVGSTHMIALKADGTIWSWGSNNSGQLAIDTSENKSSVPVQESTGATDWAAVAAGDSASYAIKKDGTLWAWGSNGGKLADGTSASSSVPVQEFTESKEWRAVYVYKSHVVAIKKDGSLWSWGTNSDGQLGTGNKKDAYIPIREATKATDWVSAAPGRYHTTALKSDGTIWSWGDDKNLQFGDGIGISSLTPVQEATDSTEWVYISSGEQVVTGIKADGSVYSWGLNASSQTGNGELGINSSDYAVESNLPAFIEFAYSNTGNMMIKEDGTLWGWGVNSDGNLGNGTKQQLNIPVQESTKSTDWVSISMGEQFSAGLKSDGTIWCWGSNGNGQLGVNPEETSSSLVPIQESTLATDWVALDAGYDHVVALKSDGTLWSWGANGNKQLAYDTGSENYSYIPVQEQTNATDWQAVAGGTSYSAAIKTDGTIWSWGSNFSGNLGDNTTTESAVPVQEFTLSTDWVEVKIGMYQTVALKSDGTIWSWGSNNSGNLGTGNTNNSSVPLQEATSSTDWQSYAVGAEYTLAIKTDGTLWSWGNNSARQLGIGNVGWYMATPTQEITAADNWAKVYTAEGYSALAFKDDGTLWGWGSNANSGFNIKSVPEPVKVMDR